MSVTEEKKHTVLDFKHPITSNTLVDVLAWLEEGAYLVLHDHFKRGRYFHKKCDRDNEDEVSNLRVIYLDVDRLPGLLDEGEWDWYIKQKAAECTCRLKSRLSDPNGLMHSVHLSLG